MRRASLISVILEAARPHQLPEDIPTFRGGWIRAASQGMGVRGNYPHAMVSPSACPQFWEISQEPTWLAGARIPGKFKVAVLRLNSLGQGTERWHQKGWLHLSTL